MMRRKRRYASRLGTWWPVCSASTGVGCGTGGDGGAHVMGAACGAVGVFGAEACGSDAGGAVEACEDCGVRAADASTCSPEIA